MLIDKIVKPGAIMNDDELDVPLITGWLRTSYVLCATNVAENIKAINSGEFNVLTDLPDIAPPFNNMFIEWSELDKDGSANHFGMVINSCDRVKEPDAVCWGREFKDVDARWSCNGFIFLFVEDKKMAIYQGHIFWGVGPHGEFVNHHRIISGDPDIVVSEEISLGVTCSPSKFLTKIWAKKIEEKTTGVPEETDPGQLASNELFGFCQVPLMSLCFMHAKNVQIVKSPAPTQHQIKAWRKKNKPLFRYHTITISQRTTRVIGGGHRGPHSSPAVHICRGHFKRFTPEKPLLGKHVGVYWWPMLLRGSKEEGVVVKDYDIKPGA